MKEFYRALPVSLKMAFWVCIASMGWDFIHILTNSSKAGAQILVTGGIVFVIEFLCLYGIFKKYKFVRTIALTLLWIWVVLEAVALLALFMVKDSTMPLIMGDFTDFMFGLTMLVCLLRKDSKEHFGITKTPGKSYIQATNKLLIPNSLSLVKKLCIFTIGFSIFAATAVCFIRASKHISTDFVSAVFRFIWNTVFSFLALYAISKKSSTARQIALVGLILVTVSYIGHLPFEFSKFASNDYVRFFAGLTIVILYGAQVWGLLKKDSREYFDLPNKAGVGEKGFGTKFETPFLIRQVECHLIFGFLSRRLAVGYLLLLAAIIAIITDVVSAINVPTEKNIVYNIVAILGSLIFLSVPCIFLTWTTRQQAIAAWLVVKIALFTIALTIIQTVPVSFQMGQADAWPNLLIGLIWIPSIELIPQITPHQRYITLARIILSLPCIYWGITSSNWHW